MLNASGFAVIVGLATPFVFCS